MCWNIIGFNVKGAKASYISCADCVSAKLILDIDQMKFTVSCFDVTNVHVDSPPVDVVTST
jgi:hypothetical protein